uniref:Uncharacterized protein n=1 Tax=Candidatus Nitrotoga fabula TaxID=2182327 RepID=A0A2X0SPE6_9PROT|nr:protein of unknown function [Candidatus Nitrotoga fabula]
MAISAGRKSVRSTPLLGLAFLISAITAGRPAWIWWRIASEKFLAGGVCSAIARMTSIEHLAFAAETSCAFVANIFCRISDMADPNRQGAHFN